MARFGGMATTIGNYLSRRSPPLADEFASVIYNGHPAKHDEQPSGETDMPQVNQPVEGDQNYGR